MLIVHLILPKISPKFVHNILSYSWTDIFIASWFIQSDFLRRLMDVCGRFFIGQAESGRNSISGVFNLKTLKIYVTRWSTASHTTELWRFCCENVAWHCHRESVTTTRPLSSITLSTPSVKFENSVTNCWLYSVSRFGRMHSIKWLHGDQAIIKYYIHCIWNLWSWFAYTTVII